MKMAKSSSASACSMTRNCISLFERRGLPPLAMLMTPSAERAQGAEHGEKHEDRKYILHGSYIAPSRAAAQGAPICCDRRKNIDKSFRATIHSPLCTDIDDLSPPPAASGGGRA